MLKPVGEHDRVTRRAAEARTPPPQCAVKLPRLVSSGIGSVVHSPPIDNSANADHRRCGGKFHRQTTGAKPTP